MTRVLMCKLATRQPQGSRFRGVRGIYYSKGCLGAELGCVFEVKNHPRYNTYSNMSILQETVSQRLILCRVFT